MQIWHVTELAMGKKRGTNSFVNYDMLRGMEEGKRLHATIQEQYKDKGWTVETPINCYFYQRYTSNLASIEGVLTGTPDMWRVKGNTLYVIDHKTIQYPNPIKLEAWWISQVTLYALMILIKMNSNYNKDTKSYSGIKNISLEIWTYYRKQTIKESLEVVKKFIQTITITKLLRDIPKWIKKQLGEQWRLAPSQAAVINRELNTFNNLPK